MTHAHCECTPWQASACRVLAAAMATMSHPQAASWPATAWPCMCPCCCICCTQSRVHGSQGHCSRIASHVNNLNHPSAPHAVCAEDAASTHHCATGHRACLAHCWACTTNSWLGQTQTEKSNPSCAGHSPRSVSQLLCHWSPAPGGRAGGSLARARRACCACCMAIMISSPPSKSGSADAGGGRPASRARAQAALSAALGRRRRLPRGPVPLQPRRRQRERGRGQQLRHGRVQR